MIIVTGGAGFIGSNIIRKLNSLGITNIIVVDHLNETDKYKNLIGLQFSEYFDRNEFVKMLEDNSIPGYNSTITDVIHMGACSNTTVTDAQYVADVNYGFSKKLLNYCIIENINFIYASSASVYGVNTNCEVDPKNEYPLNPYAFSKLLFDNYVRLIIPMGSHSIKLVGLRYFNVYGPGEEHKGSMASVPFHMYNQIADNHTFNLFEGSDGFKRDFIYIDDVVDTTLFFLNNKDVVQGIFNCGTGVSRSFTEMGDIFKEYTSPVPSKIVTPFPEHLKGKYQSFTKADILPLRKIGYANPFITLEDGLAKYYEYLSDKEK